MNFLFASWDIPNINKKKVLDEIIQLPAHFWFYEPYRNTFMLPLMTKNGNIGMSGTSNRKEGELQWTQIATKTIMNYCDNVLFPNLGCKTRIVILKTPPHGKNNEHIDCDPDKQFTKQHKFRIVLQGKTQSLYFIKKNGNQCAPDVINPFIMDGSWPHGMINDINDWKYTLVAGSPWSGKDQYTNLNIHLKRDNRELPNDYEKYYKKN